jgi:hypothetical protein
MAPVSTAAPHSKITPIRFVVPLNPMKQFSFAIVGLAVLFYLLLVWYVITHGEIFGRDAFARNVVLSALVIVGGPIPSFVLHLTGKGASFKLAGPRVAFAVSGGYAIMIFTLWWTKPDDAEALQLVELHEMTADIPYTVDLTDPVVFGDGVSVEGMSKERSQKAFLKCRFSPDAKQATVTFTVRANNIPYKGTLVVSRGAPETIGQYSVKRGL